MGAVRDLVSRLSPKAVAVVLVVVLVAVLGYVLLIRKDMKQGTAYFTSATNIYEGDPVEILGVKVGEIDKIEPGPEHVKVKFSYEAKYKVPADAKAAIISPSLIPARYIQLAPAYTGGPLLEDGGVIPIERTAVPVEFDELKKQLSEVTKTFGPEGANENGALNRILDLGKTYRGQGTKFNTFVTELSKAVETLGRGSGDMFATVRNLQQFSTVLVRFEEAITEFGRQLDDVTQFLDEDGEEFAAAARSVDDNAEVIRDWLRDLDTVAKPFVNEATEVLANLARNREALAQVLHAGPNLLQNFSNIVSPQTGSILGALSVTQLGQTGGAYDVVCGMLISSTVSPQAADGPGREQEMADAQNLCVQHLGPLFALTRNLPYPLGAPLGSAILKTPGSGLASPNDPMLQNGVVDGDDGVAGEPDGDSNITPPLPSDGLQDLLGIGGR